MRLLSFGHGYSAQALTKLLLPSGWQVIGTTRSKEKLKDLEKKGGEYRVWPDSCLSADINSATHVLISIAPGKYGDLVIKNFKKEIVSKLKNISWVGYLSTTGIYGDHKGEWVDESTKVNPTTARGHYRVKAEKEWLDLFSKYNLPIHIFRLAGIYGPGRGPFTKVKSGKAKRIIKQNQIFSRIHVDDIATTLQASIASPNPGSIYNVCDDYPAPPEDVISYAAGLLGLPEPPTVDFETAKMTEMARSFYSDSKRVRNDKIKNELNIVLKYPNYKKGLQALIKNEMQSPV